MYNIDQLTEINDDNLQFTINDQLFLDTLMMELRGKTISYSSHKAKTKRSEENRLIDKIKKKKKPI